MSRRWINYYDCNISMRNELLAWFAREGLLLQDIITSADDPDHDEIKVTFKAPIIALSKNREHFRESPDPLPYGYPESSYDIITLSDLNIFASPIFE